MTTENPKELISKERFGSDIRTDPVEQELLYCKLLYTKMHRQVDEEEDLDEDLDENPEAKFTEMMRFQESDWYSELKTYIDQLAHKICESENTHDLHSQDHLEMLLKTSVKEAYCDAIQGKRHTDLYKDDFDGKIKI